jgi:hypothetical protein
MFGMGAEDEDDTATNATYCSINLSFSTSQPVALHSNFHCRSDTQSNYSQVSGASSNWEDTDYDDRGDRASNATEAHQRHQWQQQQTQQQQQPSQQPPDAERIPKKVTYAQQLVQSVFPQVIGFVCLIRMFLFGFIREFLLRSGRQTRVPEWEESEVLLRLREFGSEQSL